ncbi:hypothetical protein NC651_035421 [Populus alba x Populus x berolinensis]|nr:hypothetical protein NC651_035421 [Populus alba x Populus x berolinensis]
MVLLEGIPQNAVAEDVERFLSGCDFVPNSVRIFVKHKTMHNDGESSPRMLPEANKLVQISLISLEVPQLEAILNFGMLNRNGRIEM